MFSKDLIKRHFKKRKQHVKELGRHQSGYVQSISWRNIRKACMMEQNKCGKAKWVQCDYTGR